VSGIGEVDDDQNAVNAAADAAFQHVAHIQIAPDLLRPRRPALVGGSTRYA